MFFCFILGQSVVIIKLMWYYLLVNQEQLVCLISVRASTEVTEMNGAGEKTLVAEAGRMLLAEGLAARTWGNVSCRIGENKMLITPSGLGYENMLPGDIVEMDMRSAKWHGTHKPSSEWAVHIAAYTAFPDTDFVIHTHQTYASAIGLSGLDSLKLSQEEETALGGVALSDYALPGTKRLAKNVFKAFKSGARCVLMAHHGDVIAGGDRRDAFERAKLLELVCRHSCVGQPDESLRPDESLAKRLTASADKEFGHAAYSAAPSVLKCAEAGSRIYSQLDDMAQMISHGISFAEPNESDVIAKLKQNELVLVPGVGGICRASTDGDCTAMCSLLEKACICELHTKALGIQGRLSALDVWLMRKNYLKNYSKKIGG